MGKCEVVWNRDGMALRGVEVWAKVWRGGAPASPCLSIHLPHEAEDP